MIDYPKTRRAFDAFVKAVEGQQGYERPLAFGVGQAVLDSQGEMLDTYYPLPNFKENYGTAAVCANVLGYINGNAVYEVDNDILERIYRYFQCFYGDGQPHPNIDLFKRLFQVCVPNTRTVITFIGENDPGPASLPDVYLRLHLLSNRLVLPNEIKASPGNIMPLLPNVAWTSQGPISAKDINQKLLDARLARNPLRVYSVDKLPHMCDYVVPPGVRIADTARVRLGAHVGQGTTVMPAGFINFNAGTRGEAMIEGRVSQGVIVGDKSDLGGAASIQGTMSGGSKVVVSVGERSLIGALAGIGIPIGDDCIVAAGVYVMPSNDVWVYDQTGQLLRTAKAHEFSGQNGLLFKHGSEGQLEVHPNNKLVELNPLLHTN